MAEKVQNEKRNTMTVPLRYRAVIEGVDTDRPTQIFGANPNRLVELLTPELRNWAKHCPTAEVVVYEANEVEVRRVRVVVDEDGEKRIEG